MATVSFSLSSSQGKVVKKRKKAQEARLEKAWQICSQDI